VYVRYVQGTTFLSVLRQQAAAEPGRPALTFRDETLSRAEFLDRVERLAALFADRGVAEGSTVVIERATTPLRDDAGKVRRSALRAERLAR
jgi:non-ribosomal peptide synthetase component E (peptide arylation enzyme)